MAEQRRQPGVNSPSHVQAGCSREGSRPRSSSPLWAALTASYSLHARQRAARRNLERDAIAYVLLHGRSLHRTGITFHFLARRDIPPADLQSAWVRSLEGTVVLEAPDGDLITVYRNRHAWAAIRRKLKYRDLARGSGERATGCWPEIAETLE